MPYGYLLFGQAGEYLGEAPTLKAAKAHQQRAPEINTYRRQLARCTHCNTAGNTRNPVTWGENPFSAEIHDDHTEYWICENCRDDLRGDI